MNNKLLLNESAQVTNTSELTRRFARDVNRMKLGHLMAVYKTLASRSDANSALELYRNDIVAKARGLLADYQDNTQRAINKEMMAYLQAIIESANCQSAVLQKNSSCEACSGLAVVQDAAHLGHVLAHNLYEHSETALTVGEAVGEVEEHSASALSLVHSVSSIASKGISGLLLLHSFVSLAMSRAKNKSKSMLAVVLEGGRLRRIAVYAVSFVASILAATLAIVSANITAAIYLASKVVTSIIKLGNSLYEMKKKRKVVADFSAQRKESSKAFCELMISKKLISKGASCQDTVLKYVHMTDKDSDLTRLYDKMVADKDLLDCAKADLKKAKAKFAGDVVSSIFSIAAPVLLICSIICPALALASIITASAYAVYKLVKDRKSVVKHCKSIFNFVARLFKGKKKSSARISRAPHSVTNVSLFAAKRLPANDSTAAVVEARLHG